MVAAGRRHLEGVPGLALTDDVDEVGLGWVSQAGARAGSSTSAGVSPWCRSR